MIGVRGNIRTVITAAMGGAEAGSGTISTREMEEVGGGMGARGGAAVRLGKGARSVEPGLSSGIERGKRGSDLKVKLEFAFRFLNLMVTILGSCVTFQFPVNIRKLEVIMC